MERIATVLIKGLWLQVFEKFQIEAASGGAGGDDDASQLDKLIDANLKDAEKIYAKLKKESSVCCAALV